ncbi:SRPBCC domain-containing protein [Blastococcus sp. TF02A-26]|uniref:SRPBCC domain-containing protein n=1 Tax=Blastococcus sp. TF02A-26 TaxID=2250577 RepID=UPI000DEA5971|nr:SRPBCC domain-containing protein [Blastococcus sp. TF02A-26]RBY84820.1 polyketide cyclase [Blastococcus sp. TF02A-26]
MSTTTVSAVLAAPRDAVHRALTEPALIARWRYPEGMRSEVEELGDGGLRVTLTYDAPDARGKTTAHSDTYRARFTHLVPGELVVEVDKFETDDPDLRGEMTTTVTLRDSPDGGTELTAVHEGVPAGIDPEQNELGWRMALDRLAALLDG